MLAAACARAALLLLTPCPSTRPARACCSGSEGLYHCDYCHKDLSSTLRIKCAVCKDFDLCLECFRCGLFWCLYVVSRHATHVHWVLATIRAVRRRLLQPPPCQPAAAAPFAPCQPAWPACPPALPAGPPNLPACLPTCPQRGCGAERGGPQEQPRLQGGSVAGLPAVPPRLAGEPARLLLLLPVARRKAQRGLLGTRCLSSAAPCASPAGMRMPAPWPPPVCTGRARICHYCLRGTRTEPKLMYL